MSDTIPIEWIQHYIEQLHIAAKMFQENSEMRAAVLVRAEYAMDLFEAWITTCSIKNDPRETLLPINDFRN